MVRRSLGVCLMVLAAGGCGDDGGGRDDAGADAGEPVDVSFEAVADPAERTDCAAERPAEGVVRAKHVTCEDELVTGSLAMGRAGDLLLENARVRFVVRGGDESASTIGAPAGGLVDAAAGDAPDAIKEIFPLFDFASMTPSAIEVVDAGGESGEARVRVLFDDAPIGLLDTVAPGLAPIGRVRGRLDYVLAADADALRVEVEITTAPGVGAATVRPGFLALLGAQELVQPGYGLLGEGRPGGEGPIVVGERATDAVALALDGPGSLSRIETIHLLSRGAMVRVVRGGTASFALRVAPAPSAAEAFAAVAEPGPVLRVEGADGDRFDVIDAGGEVALRSRLGADGSAAVPLGPGSYRVRSGFGPFFAGDGVEVAHGDGGSEVTLAPAGHATLRVSATAGGDPAAPVRVTVESGGAEIDRFVAIGPTERRLPPGDVRVHVSRGLEHDVFAADVTLAAGEATEIAPDLLPVLDTAGWVSVDLHLHSELSTDSLHPVEDAVRLLAGEGVEAAAATDHDFVTDYPGVATRAGVAEHLALASGVEVSTTVYGHVNGYPLGREPARAGYGAPVWFEMAPADVFDALRAMGDEALGGALVQVNHPRLGDASFFGSVGLDRETGHATASPDSLGLPPGTDLDDFGFEVLEVWNGYTRGGNEESFEDYLALFAAGRRFTMVGNSDSHRADHPPGSPRSFVRVAHDAPGAFDFGDVADGLRSGEVTVAAGIFVTAELAGPRAGDSVPVRVRVQAPPWVETERLRVYAGRAVAVDRALDGTEPVRLDEVVDVPLSGASFVVVRADGSRAPEPYQHFAPVGVTNPLVVP